MRTSDLSPIGTSLAKARFEMSRRDGVIVAWHEVPGTTPPRKGRPVGYGVTVSRMFRKRSITRNTSGMSCTRSYRTLRDGALEGRFPKHFVPDHDRRCLSGTVCNVRIIRIFFATTGGSG